MTSVSPAETAQRLPWRVGSVPYLNALPLVYGLRERIEFCVPAALAERLYRRELDAGLVPIAEVLLHDQYDVVDGVAIASHGPVFSVFLTHRVPLERITRVAVDVASRTSAWLVRVILKHGYHVTPEFYPCGAYDRVGEHEATVLIGDQAIRHHLRQGAQSVLDLGQAWWDLTGLPFVYAAWAVQRSVATAPALAARLRRAKADGLAHLEEIVQDNRVLVTGVGGPVSASDAAAGKAPPSREREKCEFGPAFRREYLTRYVQFDLGGTEKRAVRRFQQYLAEMGLVGSCHDLRYIA